MTIFADASALIAVIAGEPEADDLADRLDADKARLCSALSVWETVAGLRHSYTFSIASARRTVQLYLDAAAFRYADIGEREFAIAADAYAHYGKGRHLAALNMGDCFAYACAKSNQAKLLFKGAGFSKTDIAAA